MATTTNYGWTTPDDTALVKDGAAAIRSLGTAIDTTTKNLNPQTTTGAIAYRSATSNVNTSLPLGTAGQVLTVNSGATAPEWAAPSSGGMTLLSTTTLGSTSTNITGISGSYNNLLIIVRGMTSSTDDFPLIRLNNSTSTTYTYKASGSAAIGLRDGGFCPLGNPAADVKDDGTAANLTLFMTVFDYAQTTNFKTFNFGGFVQDTNQNNQALLGAGTLRSNSAVTSVTFTTNNGTYTIGGTVLIYGVK